MQKMLAIVVVCVGTILYGAADNEWPSFTKKRINKSHYVFIAGLSQEQKNEQLLEAHWQMSDGQGYPNERHQDVRLRVAAALLAGADLRKIQKKEKELKLLPFAVDLRDLPLIRLLLKKGANVRQKINLNKTIIYRAEKEVVAQELIKYGALKKPEKVKYLLHEAMKSNYEAALVWLYRECDLNPVIQNYYKETPLMILARTPQEDMYKKATFLFNRLDDWAARDLLKAKDTQGRDVFAIIRDRQKFHDRKDELDQLEKLDAYLKEIANRVWVSPSKDDSDWDSEILMKGDLK